MNRVEIFDRGQITDLQEDINNFIHEIESRPNFQLIDIKFNSYPFGEDGTDYHSAMIIYKI